MGDKWSYGTRQFYPSENHPEWYNQEGPNQGYIKEEYKTEDGKIDLNKLPLTQAGWIDPELEVEEYYIGNPGDFTEFFFDGISSKKLGITRVSDGERYNLDLSPTTKNKTVDVPGGHGYYFFGSQYKDKTFKVQIAFDNLTEAQIRRIANVFSPCNELKDFYFQNHPYKVWKVRISSPITLNTICFDEGAKHRRYKGEGTISMQAFTPFAQERLKYLDEYVKEHKKNKSLMASEAETYVNEWAEASRLLWNKEDINPEETAAGVIRKQWYPYDTTDSITTQSSLSPGLCHIWNAGDFDTDYMLYFWKQDPETLDREYGYRIRCSDVPGGSEYGEFKIDGLQLSNIPNNITDYLQIANGHFISEGNATISIENNNIKVTSSGTGKFAYITCIDAIIPGKGKTLNINFCELTEGQTMTSCTIYFGTEMGKKDLYSKTVSEWSTEVIDLDQFLNQEEIYFSLEMTGSNIFVNIDSVKVNECDAGFRINSKLSLIEGVDANGEPTGNVYNQYKTGGEYFKLPQGESWIIIDDYDRTWFRSKTREDEILIKYTGEKAGETKEENTLVNECHVMWLRNQNFLSGLVGDDFGFEYHDRYL